MTTEKSDRQIEEAFIERVITIREPDPEEGGVRILARFRLRERPNGTIERVIVLDYTDNSKVLDTVTPSVIVAIADYLREREKSGVTLY